MCSSRMWNATAASPISDDTVSIAPWRMSPTERSWVSCSDSPNRADDVSAAVRSAWRSFAFEIAIAACEASTSRSRWSSSSKAP